MPDDGAQSFSLVDLKHLSEPASKLIDAVSGAIGVLYEPTRIRKKARAEADALVLLAEGRVQAQDIEWRAAQRLMVREARRQKNIETVVRTAVEQLPDTVSEKPVDEDWVFQFFEQCQDIGDEHMQAVWAKLLAGEVTQPGAFSFRTLSVVKTLRVEDANLFTRLSVAVWHHGKAPVPILPDPNAKFLQELGLAGSALLDLQSLGLIVTYQLGSHGPGFAIPARELKDLSYYGRRHLLELPKRMRGLSLGRARLTDTGRELFSITGSSANEEYRQMVIEQWRLQGIQVVELDGI